MPLRVSHRVLAFSLRVEVLPSSRIFGGAWYISWLTTDESGANIPVGAQRAFVSLECTADPIHANDLVYRPAPEAVFE